jgi:NADH-quinone oxidoreductase subunit N
MTLPYNIINEHFNNFFTIEASKGLFSNDLYLFLFEIFFLTFIVVFLIFFVFLSNKKLHLGYYLNVSSILLNILPLPIIILIMLANGNTLDNYYLFNGFYYNDISVNFFKIIILCSFIIFAFALKTYINSLKNYDFEFVVILLLSVFSSVLILNSNDLISLFFIIELQSLSFYVLVSSKQTSSFSTEGGLKYFILGSFSSGIILFGISLIYGFTGFLSYSDLMLFLSTFQFLDLSFSLYSFSFSGFFAGLILVTIGLLFKLGTVPFHMWMPDVYEGSPMIITAYLSTIPKISILFIFFKLYYIVFFEVFAIYQVLFILTSLMSIILGSIAAIYQIKLKRLLTYSMITNTGYIVLGLSLGDVSGIYVTLFYLLSYIVIMLGLFSIFMTLRTVTNNVLIKRLNSLINLSEINPFLSFSLFILLFSIAGIPPLLGFYGKLFLFAFTLKAKMYWLTLLFVIFSVVSVFYYIRLVKIIYFNRNSSGSWTFLRDIPFSNAFIIAFITILNCIFFINPNILFKLIYNFTFYIYI